MSYELSAMQQRRKDTALERINEVRAATVEWRDPNRIVVLDIETTGVSRNTDEVLQFSMIDGRGNVLVDSLVKPYWTSSWDRAAEVNGITPSKVVDAPFLDELAPVIKGYLGTANTVVTYNGDVFDLPFIEKYGMRMSPRAKSVDMMKLCAPICNKKTVTGRPKNPKLTEAYAYFSGGKSYPAHDSLEDVKATLFVYRAWLEATRSPDRDHMQRGIQQGHDADKDTEPDYSLD